MNKIKNAASQKIRRVKNKLCLGAPNALKRKPRSKRRETEITTAW